VPVGHHCGDGRDDHRAAVPGEAEKDTWAPGHTRVRTSTDRISAIGQNAANAIAPNDGVQASAGRPAAAAVARLSRPLTRSRRIDGSGYR
jgi:hypothetical protein